jgi:glutathione S-transferase
MSEVDVKYLRDKNVPILLEKLAAEIVSKKPQDPELFLRERFSLGDEGFVKRGDTVKVYGVKLDPMTGFVLVAAAAVGAKVDLVEVDLSKPPQDFISASPFLRAPILDYKGATALESAAARFLCHNTPALPLAAQPRMVRESALEAVMSTVFSEATNAINEKIFLPKKAARPVDNVAIVSIVERTKNYAGQLERAYFRESEWLTGTSPGIADYAFGVAIFTFHSVIGVEIANSPKLAAFWSAFQALPYYGEALSAFNVAALAAQRL